MAGGASTRVRRRRRRHDARTRRTPRRRHLHRPRPAALRPAPDGHLDRVQGQRTSSETRPTGWHAWERVNRPELGEPPLAHVSDLRPCRVHPRSDRAVRPARARGHLAGLDPVLRLRAAQAVVARTDAGSARHALEETFHLNEPRAARDHRQPQAPEGRRARRRR